MRFGTVMTLSLLFLFALTMSQLCYVDIALAANSQHFFAESNWLSSALGWLGTILVVGIVAGYLGAIYMAEAGWIAKTHLKENGYYLKYTIPAICVGVILLGLAWVLALVFG